MPFSSVDLLFFLISGVIIVIVEWMLWRLFKTKIEGMIFPHETDQSSLSFFTLGRLRACAFVHTCFLLACSAAVISLFFS